MESWHRIESELLLPSKTHGLHEVRVDAVCFVGEMAPPTNVNVSPSIRWRKSDEPQPNFPELWFLGHQMLTPVSIAVSTANDGTPFTTFLFPAHRKRTHGTVYSRHTHGNVHSYSTRR